MKRAAAVSDNGKVPIYLVHFIVVGDAQDKDLAARAFIAVFPGGAA